MNECSPHGDYTKSHTQFGANHSGILLTASIQHPSIMRQGSEETFSIIEVAGKEVKSQEKPSK